MDSAHEQADESVALDVDGVVAVSMGTIVWAVGAVVLWFQRDALEAQGRTWWLATCVAGVVLGLMGLPYVVLRRRAYRAAGSASASSDSTGSTSTSSTSTDTSES